MSSIYTKDSYISEFELVAEAQDAKRLKAYLARKLESYGGISHNELADICSMFGIDRKDDAQ